MITGNRIEIKGIFLGTGIFLLCLISCSNTRSMPSDNDAFKIRFGRSGGFTNIPMEYLLKGSGDLFRIQNDTLKINSVSLRKIRKLKERLTELDFEHLNLSDPGNMTYFISVTADNYNNTVKWNDQTDNEPLKEFYKELLKHLKP
jgi:hypothetical protein